MVLRREDWAERLDEYIKNSLDKEFSYGSHDCVLWASGAVEVMTGWNPAEEFVGTYSSEEEAQAVLKKNRARSIVTLIKKKFGKPIPVGQARRGDFMLIEIDGAPFAGICVGEESLFAQSPLLRIRTIDCRMAWAVARG